MSGVTFDRRRTTHRDIGAHRRRGRKGLIEINPGLRAALPALVEPDLRGDPMSPLRWTTLPARRLARELTGQGHRIRADTVADLLREEGFSLQGNVKTLEGKQNPDRDAQFRCLNEQAGIHQAAGRPVIGVDTGKKEPAGEFKIVVAGLYLASRRSFGCEPRPLLSLSPRAGCRRH